MNSFTISHKISQVDVLGDGRSEGVGLRGPRAVFLGGKCELVHKTPEGISRSVKPAGSHRAEADRTGALNERGVERMMSLREMEESLGLRNLTPEIRDRESVEVAAGYASDLLSDVLAKAPEGSVLVTGQTHMNVVAVAVHVGIAAIIFTGNNVPDESVIQKAIEEGIPLYVAESSIFDVVGRLYALGLREAPGWGAVSRRAIGLARADRTAPVRPAAAG